MPTLQVRNLPDYIYKRIVERAKAKRCSITQETIYLLKKSLDIDEDRKEQRARLLNTIQKTIKTDGDLLPDPVLMVREDRVR